MAAGHFTGFGRSLLEEDAVVQSSMGPILDRSKETSPRATSRWPRPAGCCSTPSSAAEAGELPPGSAWPRRCPDSPTHSR